MKQAKQGIPKILIVDDHEAVRRSLRGLLASRSDWEICGEAQDGFEAIEKAKSLRPDVAIMDISMPRMNGIEATKVIRREVPECRVIVVSQNDPLLVAKQAEEIGADGYVPKSALAKCLLPTVEEVLDRHNGGNATERSTSGSNSDLNAKIKARFGILPNFFQVSPSTPEITENLWGFAKAGYLDNPLPSLFKERLFVHLSRFCEVRYCIARHAGFLMGLGRPSGDATAPTLTVTQVVRLLRRPFPGREELTPFLLQYGKDHERFEEFPSADTGAEEALFAFMTHVFLQTPEAGVCLDTLKSLLGNVHLEYVLLLLAFIRTAHYWSKIHPELALEADIEELLAIHEDLAECILKDPEIHRGTSGWRVLVELPSLRAQAERASNLLAAIVDSSDDAIISKNINGVITSWNKSAERLFQYTAEEAIGKHITLIIPHDRYEEETKILERLRRGERVDHFETIRLRKDGTLLNLSLTISPVKDATGRVVGASKVARDISERKKHEAERQKLITLTDRCTEFIGMCDMDYRPIYINEAALKLVGLSSLDEVRNIKVEDFFFPEDRDFIVNKFFPKVLREGRGEMEVRFRHFKTGATIWMIYNVFVINDLDGKPIGLGTFSQNITMRKENEQALRRSEDQLRTLAEGLESQVQQRTQELQQRNAEILAQSERLRELSSRLLQTGDEERRHIARELHDSAGQIITALGLNLGMIARQEMQSPVAEKAIQESHELIEQLSKEIRTMSYLLHPPLLDESGLTGALRWYTEGLAERSDLNIQLIISETVARLPRDMELAVFRIVQECLTNIHRHSGSKTGIIRLSRDTENVSLEVEDQGKGMSPEKVAELQAQRSGVGITGMRERVRHFGGSMHIESSHMGTKISVRFPLGLTADSRLESTVTQQRSA